MDIVVTVFARIPYPLGIAVSVIARYCTLWILQQSFSLGTVSSGYSSARFRKFLYTLDIVVTLSLCTVPSGYSSNSFH